MKSKGFLSRDFIIQVVGLLVSVAVVVTVYQTYILPVSEDIKMTNAIRASQHPDGDFVPERSIVVLLKNVEQEACLILMIWATIIIAFKFVKLSGEQSMAEHAFLKISRGERIIPEDALGHYKEVESQLLAAGELGYLDDGEVDELVKELGRVGMMLRGLIGHVSEKGIR
mgnify:CR=1 FL=1